MANIIQQRAAECYTEQGATPEQIRQAEAELNVLFPFEYKEVLLWSNGCSCRVRDANIQLWSIGDVKGYTEDYQFDLYLPGIVCIGSDGGILTICLDYRTDVTNPIYVTVPWDDRDLSSVKELGTQFSNLVDYISAHDY